MKINTRITALYCPRAYIGPISDELVEKWTIITFHVGVVSDGRWCWRVAAMWVAAMWVAAVWVAAMWVVWVTVLGAGSSVWMWHGSVTRARWTAVGLWQRGIVGMAVMVRVAVSERHDADEVDKEPGDWHKLHTHHQHVALKAAYCWVSGQTGYQHWTLRTTEIWTLWTMDTIDYRTTGDHRTTGKHFTVEIITTNNSNCYCKPTCKLFHYSTNM